MAMLLFVFDEFGEQGFPNRIRRDWIGSGSLSRFWFT